ncbi:MAG: CopD family protein [Opitutaceae bacterium]|nr:CopD family protein [Opitutaceae bacterium]
MLLSLHLLGACVWVGGHLVLAARVLPRALREKNAALVRDFERAYERIGLPALLIQVLTGLALAYRLLGGSWAAWTADHGVARVVQAKLLFLALTVALALHARLRAIPRMRDDNLPVMGAHIIAVTMLAVFFTLAGASVRFGGYPWFAP